MRELAAAARLGRAGSPSDGSGGLRLHRPRTKGPRCPSNRSSSSTSTSPGDICLVACHVWDTIGAGAAGWQTALILREGNAPLDVGPQPDYIGKDLDAIADQLIERYPRAGK